MKQWYINFVFCVLLLAVIAMSTRVIEPAHADSGVFVFGEVQNPRACQKIFIVSEKNGFSIIQIVAGPQVQNRDILSGEFERVGLTSGFDVTRNNAPIRAIVLDSLLNNTQFATRLARYCNG